MPSRRFKKVPIEDLSIGDYAEISKTITLDIVNDFSKISQDFNPIHFESNYSEELPFKKPIIHGMIAASLFSGLFGTKLPGIGCLYKSQNIRFKRPIFVGDCVKAKVEIISINLKDKVLTFYTECKVRNKVMIDGQAEIFVP
tara:strand:+ start:74 stop:499 length:426 start_codon:yes stop_codon:yes gene_type:complete